MTTIILWVMHYFPAISFGGSSFMSIRYAPGPLSLRCNEEAEIVGIDDYEMGEFAYDYVGLEQDLGVKDVEGGLERERVNATSGGREPRHHADADSSAGVSEVAEKRAV
jgi:ammonium transporter, Amt family